MEVDRKEQLTNQQQGLEGLLEDNMGKVQELFDKVAEKNPQN